MPAVRSAIVGRLGELGDVRRFLADIHGGPASLVIEGSAGIGKTAIWQQALFDARADGIAVRSCRCSESDSGWAFAGLGDLLAGLADTDLAAALPAVQSEALSAALLLTEVADGAPGSRVLGVAVLGVLRELARTGPLLLAVDDIQWLDPGSRKVLSFALRRLADEPVRLIASVRTGLLADPVREAGSARPTDPSRAADLGLPGERIVVGPVDLAALQRILRTRLGRPPTRPTLTALHQATGGNPMMCLEMARALQRRGREPAAGEPLPVPADLRVLVTERLRGLSEGARQLLLLTAALAQPTVPVVAAAVGDPGDAERSLNEVLEAGLVELDGERVRFTHPLIASIPYAGLTPDARRRLHQRLAAAVTDPEEHARHAALAGTEPSSAVAAALDTAARRARARGSIDAAAELAELAVARTPASEPDELLRRTVDAAQCRFLLGDVARARALLGGGLAQAPPGPLRVRGLLLRATIASWEQGDATVAALCEQAMAEAGDDPLLRALCHATLADTSPSGAEADLFHARSAVELLGAMDAPPPDLLGSSLTSLACNGCRLGHGLAVATLERAVALQARSHPVPVGERAGIGLGMYLKVVDRFEESRSWLRTMWTCAVDEGDDSALPLTLGHLATLECWAGDYGRALEHAVEGREHAARMGLQAPMPQSAHVHALAHLGRLDEARALGERDLAADEALGYVAACALHLRSLGFTELSAGNPEAAAGHLLRALSISSEQIGIAEPAILRLHGDAVAALVLLGRTEEAERLTHALDLSTQANHLPWSTAVAGRCHGMLLAAAGESAAAVEVLQQALVDHQLLPMPFELARTRLLLGGVLRRAGHRRDARAELAAAHGVFVALGTPVQAEQAAVELAAVGGRPTRTSALTPVEEQVAALVAAGRTNREVARSLFLSVRTVESHLGRVYRKLGLRSRSELARQLPR